MKTLILLSLTLVSLNTFAAEVGEDKKSDCSASVQTSTRAAKENIANTSSSEDKTPAVKTISK